MTLQEVTWLRHAQKRWADFEDGTNIRTAATETLSQPHFILDNPKSPLLIVERIGDERYVRWDEAAQRFVVVVARIAAADGEELDGLGGPFAPAGAVSSPIVVSAPARVAVTLYVSDEAPKGSKVWKI